MSELTAIECAGKICAHFEGFRSDPYICPAGYWTRGYGELLSLDKNADPSQWKSVTEPEAYQTMLRMLRQFQRSVNRLIYYPVSVQQEGALIDFTYNLGAGALQASTLRRVINRGDLDEAPKQFRRWIFANGVMLRGLRTRRNYEVELGRIWNS